MMLKDNTNHSIIQSSMVSDLSCRCRLATGYMNIQLHRATKKRPKPLRPSGYENHLQGRVNVGHVIGVDKAYKLLFFNCHCKCTRSETSSKYVTRLLASFSIRETVLKSKSPRKRPTRAASTPATHQPVCRRGRRRSLGRPPQRARSTRRCAHNRLIYQPHPCPRCCGAPQQPRADCARRLQPTGSCRGHQGSVS